MAVNRKAAPCGAARFRVLLPLRMFARTEAALLSSAVRRLLRIPRSRVLGFYSNQ